MNRTWIARFSSEQQGAVLIETLIAAPILLAFTFSILEFGNILWQRLQVQTGVREAARYWSRCHDGYASCSEAIATNIAQFGHPGGESLGGLRAPGWDDSSQITFSPAKASLPAEPDSSSTVTVTASVPYSGWLIPSGVITIRYAYQMRYAGW